MKVGWRLGEEGEEEWGWEEGEEGEEGSNRSRRSLATRDPRPRPPRATADMTRRSSVVRRVSIIDRGTPP